MRTRRCWAPAYGLLVALLAPLTPATAAGLDALLDLQNAISDVAERVKPCVVSITTEHEVPQLQIPIPVPGGPQFGIARGSGMIFRETPEHYYILTNAHVVRGARNGHVKIKLVAERSERDGIVVGTPDRRTDTAVVRIDRKEDDHLPTVTFGSVKDLRVGAFVLAIGSPFDFEASVTLGVISSLNRELEEPAEARTGRAVEVYRGLIQTDASINPGNSGGPLVNVRGEVVGINFAIFSPGTRGNIGIGFAIPIDRAKPVIEDLIERGHAVRGYLGVFIVDLDAVARDRRIPFEELKNLLQTDTGVFVSEVTPGTPAERAGLENGDVIIAVDGEAVSTSGELQDLIGAAGPGAEVALELLRDGTKLTVRVTLGELPWQPEAEATAPIEPAAPWRDPLGLTVEDLTTEKAGELGVDGPGVLVTDVSEGSLGARHGLRPGTVICGGRRPGQERVEFDGVQAYRTFMGEAAQNGEAVLLWFSAPLDDQRRVDRSDLIRVPRPEEVQE